MTFRGSTSSLWTSGSNSSDKAMKASTLAEPFLPSMYSCKIYQDQSVSERILKLWISYTKINSKWIKDLNVRPKTIKLLEEDIGKTLSNINHSRILYDPSPRILEIKAEINKWDLIKIKSFCTTKKTISKVKR